jgi:hypothetical protein
VTVDSAKKLLGVFGISEEADLNEIKEHLGDLNSDPKTLRELLRSKMGDKPDAKKVTALSQQLNAIYNTAHARMAKAQLSELAQGAFSGLIDRGNFSQFVGDMAALLKNGRYEEDKLDQAVLGGLGIKGYDASVIKKMRDMVNFIQKLPENSDMQNTWKNRFKSALAMEILNGKWQNAGEGIKGAFNRGRMIFTDIAPDLFRSLILTGPQTFMTHGFSGNLNTRVAGATLAYGYLAKAMKEGNSFGESMGYLKDYLNTMLIPGTNGARSDAHWKQAISALATGETGMTAKQGQSKRGADAIAQSNFGGEGDLGKLFRGYSSLASYGGRAMLAFDAVNGGSAEELGLRLATRAALLESGVKGKDLEAKIQKIFAPTQEEMMSSRDQLQKEVDAGHFAGLSKSEDYFRRAARLDQLHMDKALKETLTPEVLAKAREKAQEFSKESTLKGELTGIPGYLASQIGSATTQFPLLKYCFPFIRIIGTLMNTSLEYTPFGLLKANNHSLSNALFEDSRYAQFRHKKYEAGSPEQLALMARAVIGTTAMSAMLYSFIKNLQEEIETGETPFFAIYGEGPHDKDHRNAMTSTGWGPGTIKIGNAFLPYKAIPGLNLFLTAMGELHDELVFNNPPPKIHGKIQGDAKFNMDPEKIAGMALAVTKAPLQHHFLDGLKNLIDILGSEGSGGAKAIRGLENLTISPLTQFTNPSGLRTARQLVEGAASETNEYNVLDQSGFLNKLWAFSPAYFGYNKPSLNVLGEPITRRTTDSITNRWVYNATMDGNPILTPLGNHGLHIPGAKKNNAIRIDDKGTLQTIGRSGDDAWREYVMARGRFFKAMLTPNAVNALINMPREEAQAILEGPDMSHAANKYAALYVEEQIATGKLKVN